MDKLSEIKESRPLTAFCGGQSGSWKVLSLTTFIGQPLESIDRIEIINAGHSLTATNSKWVLRGVIYVFPVPMARVHAIRHAVSTSMIMPTSPQNPT
jgi:hypothetical protein